MRRLVRTACLGGLAALLVATSMPVRGADDEMAKIIEYRQRLMKASAEHAIDIGMILKGEVPFDARHIQWHAEALYAMSKLIIQCFPKGSGSAAGKTEAKDEIGRSGISSCRTRSTSKGRPKNWSRLPRPVT